MLEMPRIDNWGGSIAYRLVVALAAIGFAVLGRIFLDQIVTGVVPFAMTFPAVILAAFLGGWLSGLVSVAGCQLLVWYFVLPERMSFDLPSTVEAVSLVMSTIAELMSVAFAVMYRNASHRLQAEAMAAAEVLQLSLRELDHRTKNNFQIAAAILTSQAKRSEPKVSAELRQAASRLVAIAGTYRSLVQFSHSFEEVRLGECLRGLCDQLNDGLLLPGITLTYSGDDITVPAGVATNVGLIVNEWITNSLKYAFPDAGGHVLVTCAPKPSHVEVQVCDDGIGIGTKTNGLGTELANILAQNIGATISVKSAEGTCCTLTVPTSH